MRKVINNIGYNVVSKQYCDAQHENSCNTYYDTVSCYLN